ncbi:AraC family transcriptional regulator [Hyphococcus flavus]|uniref:AraC family transcriptional regulator n=1 Tax=Hyphococcus flavus TaxID=1866326 RepID=A0AAE9ZBH1_9PROT|nr:AraC family transcriptional regulator [Hyphococcus flavus]WDI30125.1 AraC family transcriptional regulator [Hyphococcus flavus]
MIIKERGPIEALFDCLADVVFFIKDRTGRYIVVNDTLVRRSGAQRKNDLIGKTPSQVLGASLGAGYEKQDQAVLETGEPILNQLELHIYPNRSIGWCMTNKRALHSDNGALAGLTGISQDLRAPDINHEDYAQLKTVIEYTDENLSDPPDLKTLASVGRMSPYQLDRRMRHIFGLTTGQWVLKQRLDFARRELLQSEKPIIEIAMNAGYRDQSAFSRQFLRATGFAPTAFRKTQKA